jgi:hypothetical protein
MYDVCVQAVSTDAVQKEGLSITALPQTLPERDSKKVSYSITKLESVKPHEVLIQAVAE